MMRFFPLLFAVFFGSVVLGDSSLYAQRGFPCKPAGEISFQDFEQTIGECPEVRRILSQSEDRLLTVLLKNGGVATFAFKRDSLASVETLWTYAGNKAAEATFYKIYDELLNADATPISFSADKEISSIVAETETQRFNLSMQDMLQPNVIVVLIVEALK